MSVTPAPTHAVVKYQSPSERAYSAAGKTALGLVIALLIPLVSLGVKYLVTGDFSHTAFVALLTAAGVAAGGVVLQFLLKLQSAIGDNTPPTVSADGTPPASPASVFAPPITAATLRDLLATVDVLQQWQRPIAPPMVTPPPVAPSVPLGAFAPVKPPPKGHPHHAKPPAVLTPIDPVSDH